MRQVNEEDLDRLTQMYTQALNAGRALHEREHPETIGDPTA